MQLPTLGEGGKCAPTPKKKSTKNAENAPENAVRIPPPADPGAGGGCHPTFWRTITFLSCGNQMTTPRVGTSKKKTATFSHFDLKKAKFFYGTFGTCGHFA